MDLRREVFQMFNIKNTAWCFVNEKDLKRVSYSLRDNSYEIIESNWMLLVIKIKAQFHDVIDDRQRRPLTII